MSLSLNLIKLDIINMSIPCLFMAYISAPLLCKCNLSFTGQLDSEV